MKYKQLVLHIQEPFWKYIRKEEPPLKTLKELFQKLLENTFFLNMFLTLIIEIILFYPKIIKYQLKFSFKMKQEGKEIY